MEQKQDKNQLTAAQRLMGLEDAVRYMDSAIGGTAQRVEQVVKVLDAVTQRLQALETALSKFTAVTSELITNELITLNVQKLKDGVEELKERGVIAATDVVGENSFVVGREVKIGTLEVANPRAQFWMEQITDEKNREKVLGKKVGDKFSLSDSENPETEFEIEEIYNYQEPQKTEEKETPVQ